MRLLSSSETRPVTVTLSERPVLRRGSSGLPRRAGRSGPPTMVAATSMPDALSRPMASTKSRTPFLGSRLPRQPTVSGECGAVARPPGSAAMFGRSMMWGKQAGTPPEAPGIGGDGDEFGALQEPAHQRRLPAGAGQDRFQPVAMDVQPDPVRQQPGDAGEQCVAHRGVGPGRHAEIGEPEPPAGDEHKGKVQNQGQKAGIFAEAALADTLLLAAPPRHFWTTSRPASRSRMPFTVAATADWP